MFTKTASVARKELVSFFTSPIAYIFIGAFLLTAYFIFFWVDTFFARNIADLRPLFAWMPMILIFLVSAVTMRMWSEERRQGTLEFLLTTPVKVEELVLGKFLACLSLIVLSLLLTFSLPLTVSWLGELDWGPVIGAYLAALLLASAYIAIGLFVSSRCENQIVSLIITIVVCLAFYLIGLQSISAFFGSTLADILRQFSTSARFDSITRGVIDFRDLYYYFSLTVIFLALNVYALEKFRWSQKGSSAKHKNFILLVALLGLNLLIANLWLKHVPAVRADLTGGNIYTLSDATKNIVANLPEPLLIRGYFSTKTHPLLAPLIPQVKDLLTEYKIAGKGNVRAEFLDPKDDAEKEEEAGTKYNIKPTPLQMQDKYQASLVNAYFNILIEYGDKYEVLSFRELIEVNAKSEGELDVRLRNLEYDITRTIKKLMYGFQSIDSLFASLKNPAEFKAYFSTAAKLPEKLAGFVSVVNEVNQELEQQSGGKYKYSVVDPDADGGKVAAEIATQYGFQPMVASLFESNPFYFYMLLQSGEQIYQISLPQNLSKEELKRSVESTLKRLSPGFLKTVGLVTPPNAPENPYMPPSGPQFSALQQKLSENLTVKNVALSSGSVPADIDLLMLLAPKDLSDKELFAVDQFLMRGGTIVTATSPVNSKRQRDSLALEKTNSGLAKWLLHHGIEMQEKIVMDPQNEPFPVPVNRNLGGYTVQEIRYLNYPPFVDIRQNGMSKDNSMLSGLQQVTLNWPSPVIVNADLNKARKVSELLKSSSESWATDNLNPIPDVEKYPELGFPIDGEKKQYLLAAAINGEYQSYFKGKDLSFLKTTAAAETEESAEAKKDKPEDTFSAVIEKSPETAGIILIASNEFLNDQTLQMSSVSGNNRYMNSLQLVENAVDWSLSDPALLSIRGRGSFSRTLLPLTDSQKTMVEYLNYAAAVFSVLLLWFIFRVIQQRKNSERYDSYLEVANVQA